MRKQAKSKARTDTATTEDAAEDAAGAEGANGGPAHENPGRRSETTVSGLQQVIQGMSIEWSTAPPQEVEAIPHAFEDFACHEWNSMDASPRVRQVSLPSNITKLVDDSLSAVANNLVPAVPPGEVLPTVLRRSPHKRAGTSSSNPNDRPQTRRRVAAQQDKENGDTG
ncbi:hypothetical protein FOMPIDRAFT_94909 [Fomitopsis schrenkii]|uniref:Uncharacterized protein n=1 Tax=Fomitopsis schrenkii TaxID=2126942 RepID=S8DY53_FOMSC|nr:hypothetical protein FOMPIDRAFT_94909 [Fomitopsis schrenkii]